jgi:protein disulfide-isomerase-like protein
MNFLVCLIYLLSVLSFVRSESDVIELTDQNFEHDTQIGAGATTGSWLIEFYAPWCGHCKKLAPVYEEVATGLKGKVNVAKVDATVNKNIGTRFGVKGYPTILLFRNDKMVKYSGPRTVDKMMEWALSDQTQVNDVIPPKGGTVQDAMPSSQDKDKKASSKTKTHEKKNMVITILEDIVKIFETKTIPTIIILLIGVSLGFLLGLMLSSSTSTSTPTATTKIPPPPSSYPPSYPPSTKTNDNTTSTSTSSNMKSNNDNAMNNHIPNEENDKINDNNREPKDDTLKKEE